MKKTLKRVVSCLFVLSILFSSSANVFAENTDVVNDATVVVENSESTEIIVDTTENTLSEEAQEEGEFSEEISTKQEPIIEENLEDSLPENEIIVEDSA